ncbi:MAG: large repetitive protein [Acidobacteriota bacterium]|jgi:hypothetical protein|nr:large repetitive protein [Acidobacteriota bacterium]
MQIHTSRWFIALSLLIALAVPAFATVQPLGKPFRVNRTDDFQPQNPVAAFAASGNSLVVWENGQSGLRGLFQRPDGTAASSQLTLVANETLAGLREGTVRTRKDPAVAFLPNGSFLLAWTEERAYLRAEPFFEDRQVEDQDVYIQRFEASGTPSGARFRVNATEDGFQAVPKIAVLANGNALVLWKSLLSDPAQGGIVGRLVSATGQPFGADVKVSEDPTADHPAVAAGRNGFLVAWDMVVDGQIDVFARLYDASGAPVGAAGRVNPSAAGTQRWPAVAQGANGNFLVAWQSYLTDRSQVHIYGRLLSQAGSFLSPSFSISREEGTQLAPALAPTKNGFLAAWLDWAGKSYGIRAVELTATGSRSDSELWVTNSGVAKNYRKSIATDAKGGYLIPWESNATRQQVIVARELGQ